MDATRTLQNIVKPMRDEISVLNCRSLAIEYKKMVSSFK
jgi:hypothetical protein